MKKSIFFIIISILQINLSLFMIINVHEVVESQLSALELGQSYFEKILSNDNSVLYEEQELDEEIDEMPVHSNSLDDVFNASFEDLDMRGYLTRFLIFSAILIILFHLIILIISITRPILLHKKRIVVYSVITFLLGLNILCSLLALIEFIVILCLKPQTDEEKLPKTPRFEPLEYNYFDKKSRIIAVLFILMYAIFHFAIPSIIEKVITEYSLNSIVIILLWIGTIILDLIIFISALFMFKEELKVGLISIKNNVRGFRRYTLVFLAISYGLLLFFNVLRLVITGNTYTENQAQLNELPMAYLLITASIWAPIVEELIFRASIRRFIKNKYAFVAISGIIFGVLHATSEGNAFLIAISSLPYIALGISMASAYVYKNNIWANIMMHAINNFVGCVLMILVTGK